MSSSGVTVADGCPQMYFCHQCERTVSITPFLAGEILCPSCNSGFVEEYQNPNPNPAVPDTVFPDPLSLFLSQFVVRSENVSPSSQSTLDGNAPLGPDVFDPLSYLFNFLANRRASGIDYQFVMEDHPSDAGFPLHANIGDYFVGPGFEQLIQQLAENDPNRHGTPPAAKSAVAALPIINVDQALLKSELAQCAVCKDDFVLGTVVKQMPCNHVYHEDCILPWLELHNSCPVCRYELSTDDPDYDSNVNSGQRGDDGGPRTAPRRFTIPLPWFFGSDSGSGGEGSEQN